MMLEAPTSTLSPTSPLVPFGHNNAHGCNQSQAPLVQCGRGSLTNEDPSTLFKRYTQATSISASLPGYSVVQKAKQETYRGHDGKKSPQTGRVLIRTLAREIGHGGEISPYKTGVDTNIRTLAMRNRFERQAGVSPSAAYISKLPRAPTHKEGSVGPTC